MRSVIFFILAVLTVSPAFARDFSEGVKLDEFRSLTVQHRQTLKTMDSWARQTITAIAGRSSLRFTGDASIEGKDPLFTALDISFRPEKYFDKNVIRIRNVPLRQDFEQLTSISDAEKRRILEQGTISMQFFISDEVQQLLEKQQSTAMFKMEAIQQLHNAAMELRGLMTQGLSPAFPNIAMVAPMSESSEPEKWRQLLELQGNSPIQVQMLKERKRVPPPALPGYRTEQVEAMFTSAISLIDAWRRGNVDESNAALAALVHEFPKVNEAAYPPAYKRQVEVVYNRFAKLTMPAAFLYLAAFVCFLLSARAEVMSLRLWGLRLFLLGFIVHTLGIAIRWWLVSKTHGNWFDSIPIKNQFESVLMSAWFGCLAALVLALWRNRAATSIIGAAGAFIGALSLVAIFTAPMVFGKDIGGEIGQVAGVLMSYWLYIHVTIVTASYALIGMSMVLGVWWIAYYLLSLSRNKLEGVRNLRSLSAEPFQVIEPGGAVARMSFVQTLIATMFFIRPRAAEAAPAVRTEKQQADAGTINFLRTLDVCNMVVLQIAFWMLGVGIILGAIWADESWGRPWGWDPKETFALVTWIVYLIVVHIRLVVENKAMWTAWLSVLGFIVMLFNWIGVNFFLVGLHSYA